ncbi:MAG: hypothetical protein ACP5GS_06535, partial [Nitrososphaeria archaeon]
GRWYTAKYGDGSRRQYIKLHALSSADTDMPSLQQRQHRLSKKSWHYLILCLNFIIYGQNQKQIKIYIR